MSILLITLPNKVYKIKNYVTKSHFFVSFCAVHLHISNLFANFAPSFVSRVHAIYRRHETETRPESLKK